MTGSYQPTGFFSVTEHRLKLSHVLSLVFVGAIFAFVMFSSLPGDGGLLTDSVVQSSQIRQVS
jgi:hypothetical protein